MSVFSVLWRQRRHIQSNESCSIKLNFLHITSPESSALCISFSNSHFSDATDQILIMKQVILQGLQPYLTLKQFIVHCYGMRKQQP